MIWQLNDVLTPVQCDNILSVYQEHRFHCGSDSNPREGVKKASVLIMMIQIIGNVLTISLLQYKKQQQIT